MSDTTQTTPKPAAAIPETVTDSLGRVLTIKRLDALAELDLVEAAGANAENRRWMMMSTLAACVTEIDGIPQPSVSNRNAIRARVKAVGSEGVAAVMQALAPDELAAGAPDEAETAATAKN